MKKRRRNRGAGQSQLDLFTPITTVAPTPPKSPNPAPVKHVLTLPTKAREQSRVSAPHDLLDVRQAAARLGLSKSTLDKMRRFGTGPRFVKSTTRAVRYDPRDLEAWIDERRRKSVVES